MKIEKLQPSVSLERPIENGSDEQLRVVRDVIQDVKQAGDEALKRYTAKWDGVELENFRVTAEEMDKAVARFDQQLYADLKEAAANIRPVLPVILNNFRYTLVICIKISTINHSCRHKLLVKIIT